MDTLRDLETKASALSTSLRREITEILVFERKMKERYQEILQQVGAGKFLLLYMNSQSDQIIKLVIRRDAKDKNKAVEILAEDAEIDIKIRNAPSFSALGEIIVEINDIKEKDKIISKLKYGF